MGAAWTPDLLTNLHIAADDAGFDKAGVAAAPRAGEPEGRLTAQRFSSWIDAGYAGEMGYLKRTDDGGTLLRTSARIALPWARSVVVCALNYNAKAPRSIDPADDDAAWIARYAWSGNAEGRPVDYHVDLMARLQKVELALKQGAEFETRCYVDTGPILERDFAARAGVGWIGKNTCVIDQQRGSWMLLGVIVTSLELPSQLVLPPAADRCGSCTRCIDACPTDALIAPRQMDASRCISYLTIEHKGVIAEGLREPMGRQVFGCDICQDVCPRNRKAPIAQRPEFTARESLVNPSLGWLGAMEAEEFRLWFKGSPLERTKLKRIQRNVAIAMGNTADERYVPRLKQWAGSADEVLADAARWALGKIGNSSASIDGLSPESME